MFLTEEILDEILVDYILENFEIEDEEDLEYVYESLSEDDVDYILNEFNDFNYAKAHILPPKLGKFRQLKKSAKDSFYKAKERFFRPKPKKDSGYPKQLELDFSQNNMSDTPGLFRLRTARLKAQEAIRRKAATKAAIQRRLAQQAAISNPFPALPSEAPAASKPKSPSRSNKIVNPFLALPSEAPAASKPKSPSRSNKKASSYLPKDILSTGERERSDFGKYQGKRGLIHPRKGGLPTVISKSTGAPLYGGSANFKSMFPGTKWKVKTKK